MDPWSELAFVRLAGPAGPLPGAWGRLSLPQKPLGEGRGQPSASNAAASAWQ